MEENAEEHRPPTRPTRSTFSPPKTSPASSAKPPTPSRITTRSSSSPHSPSSNPLPHRAKKSRISKQSPVCASLLTLLSKTNHSSVSDRQQQLLSRFPRRGTQIAELNSLIGPPGSPTLPLFVFGSPFTGKTSVVLHTLRFANRPFVYVSCRSCYSPRILFESVLDQLSRRERTAENGYANLKCDKVSDFIVLLKVALGQAKSRAQAELGVLNGEVIYLVIDDVELIRDWSDGSDLIKVLFSLTDFVKLPELGLILISSVSLDDFPSETVFVEPIAVYFPGYAIDDIYKILTRKRNSPLYASFLESALRPLCRVTKRINELSIALDSLYQKYCEPLSDLSITPDQKTKVKLFGCLKPHLKTALNRISHLPSSNGHEVNPVKVKRGILQNHGGANDTGLDFHMSISAKFLLISAYLASRNPATLDAALFDPAGGTDTKKRKRKSSETSVSKKEVAAEELLLRGPGTFTLERLLAIYQCITFVESSPDSQQRENGLMSNVLLQLSTLCNANFVYRGGTCPIEDASRYRCMLDEEKALKIARSVNFPLSNYLYRSRLQGA